MDGTGNLEKRGGDKSRVRENGVRTTGNRNLHRKFVAKGNRKLEGSMDSRGEMTAFLYTVKNASIENLNGDQGEGRIAGLVY